MAEQLRHSLQLNHPEGGHLKMTLASPASSFEELILFVHGFGSVRNGRKALELKRECSSRGWAFAAADFRGHGESSGTLLDLCGSGLQADLDVVIEHLQSYGVKKLYLVGSSMGGWASSWLTIRRPELIGAFVGLAPSFDFPQARWDALSSAEQQQWKETGRIRFRNQFIDTELSYRLPEERDLFPLARLEEEWSKPLLIIHGMQDDVVPYEKSVAFAHRAQCSEIELHLFKDGCHRLEDYRKRIAEDACNFFTRWM